MHIRCIWILICFSDRKSFLLMATGHYRIRKTFWIVLRGSGTVSSVLKVSASVGRIRTGGHTVLAQAGKVVVEHKRTKIDMSREWPEQGCSEHPLLFREPLMDYLDLFRHYNRIPDRVCGSLKLTGKNQWISHGKSIDFFPSILEVF